MAVILNILKGVDVIIYTGISSEKILLFQLIPTVKIEGNYTYGITNSAFNGRLDR